MEIVMQLLRVGTTQQVVCKQISLLQQALQED